MIEGVLRVLLCFVSTVGDHALEFTDGRSSYSVLSPGLPFLMNATYSFAAHYLINYPFEALAAFDHVNDKDFLERCKVL